MISFQTTPAEQMLEQARRIFPDECCGFLYGTEDKEGNRIVREMTAVDNSKEGDKRRRFEISGRDYLRAERYANEKDLLLIGIYHSHPNHPAIPSEHDRVAAQPYFSYIIISVMQGNIDHIRSWRLADDALFTEENLSPIHHHQSI
jgi:proteasome lid subunit RPN8/RPN11